MLGFKICCLEYTSIQSVPNLGETLQNTFHCSHRHESPFCNQFSWKFLSTKIEIHVCSQSPSRYALPITQPYSCGEWRLLWASLHGRDSWTDGWWHLVPQRWIEPHMEKASPKLTRDSIWAAGFPFLEHQPVFCCAGKAFQSIGVMASSWTAPHVSQCSQSWAKINKACAQAWLLGNDNCFLSCRHVLHWAI